MVENKGKLILTEIFPSVQKHDILVLISYMLSIQICSTTGHWLLGPLSQGRLNKIEVEVDSVSCRQHSRVRSLAGWTGVNPIS